MLRNSFLCRDGISRDLSIDLVAIMQQLVISVLPIRYSSGYNESCTANCNPSLFRRKTPIWLQCNIVIRNAICGAICDFAFGTKKIIYVCGVARFGPTNVFEKAH